MQSAALVDVDNAETITVDGICIAPALIKSEVSKNALVRWVESNSALKKQIAVGVVGFSVLRMILALTRASPISRSIGENLRQPNHLISE